MALALRELGRIERTLFTPEWLQSPELRRRVQVGLNKGEARNTLARAVFFNRLGEIRDRSFENQRYRASGLNLVVAAIALWNTMYLQRAISALRKQQPVDDILLKHLSPLGWEHINLTGDYEAGKAGHDRQRLSPCGSSLSQACRERSKNRCLLGRELLITLAPQKDKCVVVTVRGPRTGRYFAKLDELPVTRIFDAKTQVIANRRRHI